MNGPLVSKLSIVAGGIAVEETEAGDLLWGAAENADIGTFVHGDYMAPYGHPLLENTSFQYSSVVDACYSDEKPLWWLVLRWLKMMLLKTARSYHAKPLLLMAAPLCVGMSIGFILGKWNSQTVLGQPKSNDEYSKKGDRPNELEHKTHQTVIGRVVEYISAFWYCLCLFATSFQSEKHLSSLDVHESIDIHGSIYNRKIQLDNRYAETHENDTAEPLATKEERVRSYLKSDEGTLRECDVPIHLVPKHVAVIMDGNRRYGKAKYGSATKGHWDGSSKLVEFAKWCIAEKVAVLTVYAFSSENWKRDPAEIASLMQIFTKYCDELRIEAIQRNIKIMVLSTDYEKIPGHVKEGVKRMVNETKHCNGMIMNICLSYGSRNEIVGATKEVVDDVLRGTLDRNDIDDKIIGERLLTSKFGGDPDVLIRTSGEFRLSNFLLWQLAYSEFFFVDKPWPAIEKNDLLEVIRTYAQGRNRRFGK